MLIKLLLVLLLFYWIGKTVGNLMRAIRQDASEHAAVPPRDARPPATWNGSNGRPASRPSSDIEDARWVDLDERS